LKTVAELRARYGSELRRDVDVLLGDLLGRSVAFVHAHGESEVDEERLDALLRRRMTGEPLQYIRGRADFYGREFIVDDRVLIPRPETELLVEEALRRLPRGARVLDIGAGSGCVSVTLALERPDLTVFAVDVSTAALAVARRNRERLGADLWLAASDVLDSLRGRFDAIVSNPPYIAGGDVPSLQTEVRDHEPHLALTPGSRGTEVIERLFAAPLVLVEIGFGQEEAVRTIARKRGYGVDAVIADLAAIPRVVVSSPAL
jgi:release factor glutamine methyltransferase